MTCSCTTVSDLQLNYVSDLLLYYLTCSLVPCCSLLSVCSWWERVTALSIFYTQKSFLLQIRINKNSTNSKKRNSSAGHASLKCFRVSCLCSFFKRRRVVAQVSQIQIRAFLLSCHCPSASAFLLHIFFAPLIFTPRISHPWFLPIASAKYLHVGSGKTQKRENVWFCPALRERSKSTTNLFKKITQTNCLIEIYSHITIKNCLLLRKKAL